MLRTYAEAQTLAFEAAAALSDAQRAMVVAYLSAVDPDTFCGAVAAAMSAETRILAGLLEWEADRADTCFGASDCGSTVGCEC